MKTFEKILCAAIWYSEIPIKKEFGYENRNPVNIKEGLVFAGFRHCHCMYTMVAVTGLRSCESEVGKEIQGFITNKNRFVDRKEGLQIALKAKQILDISDIRGDNLYSEDIY